MGWTGAAGQGGPGKAAGRASGEKSPRRGRRDGAGKGGQVQERRDASARQAVTGNRPLLPSVPILRPITRLPTTRPKRFCPKRESQLCRSVSPSTPPAWPESRAPGCEIRPHSLSQKCGASLTSKDFSVRPPPPQSSLFPSPYFSPSPEPDREGNQLPSATKTLRGREGTTRSLPRASVPFPQLLGAGPQA